MASAAGDPDAVLRGHLTDVQAAAFVACRGGAAPLLATGALDGLVLVWAADGGGGGAPLLRWVAHGSGVAALVSPEPGVLWSQGRDGWVYRWALDVGADAWGAPTLRAPVREAALPVGFGSFCRMSVLRRAGAGAGAAAATLVAAPSLNSEAVEVWSTSSPRPAAAGAAGGGRGGPHAPQPQRIPGVVTPVHIESAPPGAFAQPAAVECTHVATIALAPRRRGASGADGSAGRELPAPQPTHVPATASDGDYCYTKESEQAEAEAQEEEGGGGGGGALARLQRQSGMLTCVQLLDPAVVYPPGAAAATHSGPGRPAWGGGGGGALGGGDDTAAGAVASAGSADDGDADDGSPVQHPFPHATSLRELLAAGAAAPQPPPQLQCSDSGGPFGDDGSVAAPPGSAPLPPPPTTLSRATSPPSRPGFLLAATFENGHFYVLSDAAPVARGPRAAVAAAARAGLAALREAEELEACSDGPPAGGGGGGGGSGRATGAAATATRSRVLVDLHLANEPLFTFTLDAACRLGLAGGAGGELLLFALDIPARTATVTGRLALATPGVSVSALLQPSLDCSGGGGGGGAIAVTGCWDHAARLVDLAAGAHVAELRWHDASIYALAGVEVAAMAAAADGDGGEGSTDDDDAGALHAAPATERVFRVATGAKDGRVALWTLSVAQQPGC